MTLTPDFLPTPSLASEPRICLFVAFPGMGLLDITGPLTVFWSASTFLEDERRPGYVRHTVSLDGGPIVTAEGVTIETLPIARFEGAPIDTLVIPGALDLVSMLADRRLVAWLSLHAPRARRIASICAGAFLLAEAGLLRGRRVVTHWASCAALRDRYDSLSVEPDAIFVQDGPVWTSAGVTAGIDLALALIQDDCGHEVAMQVARQLVIYIKRPGGQSQFSELLKTQSSSTTGFDALHHWIAEHLGDNTLNVERMAGTVGMSPRNFARAYKAATGRTPAKTVELFRLEAARRRLEEGDEAIDRIARTCGFGDEERMRTTFRRHLAIAPRDYRLRFSRQVAGLGGGTATPSGPPTLA